MDFNKKPFLKIALLIVATSFLLYNLYQAIITTIFVSHFPQIINQLPNVIKSSQPALQLGLFLFQEIAASVGGYLRLAGAIFAVYCTILFLKNDGRYFEKLRRVLLFESLYFLFLFPAAINHIVGLIISRSEFLNFYAGVSCLLQAVLIFPALFILSYKLRKPRKPQLIIKWVTIAAPLYVFGFWIRHALLWLYALMPLGTQNTDLLEVIGSANSLLTLLFAAIFTTIISLSFRQNKKLNRILVATALFLMGFYFAIYIMISVWLPIYLSFIPLTDFWMITFLILGISVWRDSSENMILVIPGSNVSVGKIDYH